MTVDLEHRPLRSSTYSIVDTLSTLIVFAVASDRRAAAATCGTRWAAVQVSITTSTLAAPAQSP